MTSSAGALLAATLLSVPLTTQAMGLRSLVALPVDKGGTVIRFQYERAEDTGADRALFNAAYGIGARQAILVGVPYRLSPGGGHRPGDLAMLYRHTVRQKDFAEGTHRVALMAGLAVPTDGDRDGAVQLGVVSTVFRERHEWDVDAIYRIGVDQRPDGGQSDIAWQYRLAPAQRREWGVGSELNVVLEWAGRWAEASKTIHQVTVGLQWIHPRWVLEGGIFRDVNGPRNGPRDTHLLVSTRFHF